MRYLFIIWFLFWTKVTVPDKGETNIKVGGESSLEEAICELYSILTEGTVLSRSEHVFCRVNSVLAEWAVLRQHAP